MMVILSWFLVNLAFLPQSMLEEERAKSEQQKTTPHLWNLHEDEALTAKVLHFVKEGELM